MPAAVEAKGNLALRALVFPLRCGQVSDSFYCSGAVFTKKAAPNLKSDTQDTVI